MVGLFKNNRNIFETGLKKKVTPVRMGQGDRAGPDRGRDHRPYAGPHLLCAVVGLGQGVHPVGCDQQSESVCDQSGLARGFDQDGDVAEKTRRRVYDMVVAEKLQVQGFHYPFPGLGNVVKDGEWLPCHSGAVESGYLSDGHSGARASANPVIVRRFRVWCFAPSRNDRA